MKKTSHLVTEYLTHLVTEENPTQKASARQPVLNLFNNYDIYQEAEGSTMVLELTGVPQLVQECARGNQEASPVEMVVEEKPKTGLEESKTKDSLKSNIVGLGEQLHKEKKMP